MSTHGGSSFPVPDTLFRRGHRVSRSPFLRSFVPYLQIYHNIIFYLFDFKGLGTSLNLATIIYTLYICPLICRNTYTHISMGHILDVNPPTIDFPQIVYSSRSAPLALSPTVELDSVVSQDEPE